MAELLTQAEAARRLGVTRQAVANAWKRGSLNPANWDAIAYQNAPPMFDVGEVDRWDRQRKINTGGRGRKASA